MTRYDVTSAEGEFEPGSDGRVLRNLVGIRAPEDMDQLELELLGLLYEAVLIDDLPEQQLTVADLVTWHRRWLGNVYPWAGQYRQVNMSKGDFMFAAAQQIPRLMATFEEQYLSKWTPCQGLVGDTLTQAIAVSHVELILIHPFREGNGRLSRLLADVMAMQAGHEPLDYSSWDREKDRYIQAIHAGVAGDYAPMQSCVRVALNH